MAIYIKPSWRRYIPHLEVFINIPLIRIQMQIMRDNLEYFTFTYFAIRWLVWKWDGTIRLFDMGNKMHQVNINQDDARIKKCGCWFSHRHQLQYYCDKHTINSLKTK